MKNEKEEFTIEGPDVLMKALIEETKCPLGEVNLCTIEHMFEGRKLLPNRKLFLVASDDNKGLLWTLNKRINHYILPMQWNEASQMIKCFYKTEINLKSIDMKNITNITGFDMQLIAYPINDDGDSLYLSSYYTHNVESDVITSKHSIVLNPYSNKAKNLFNGSAKECMLFAREYINL
jgi:hypothetical protein